jgi:hypothetical protein
MAIAELPFGGLSITYTVASQVNFHLPVALDQSGKDAFTKRGRE